MRPTISAAAVCGLLLALTTARLDAAPPRQSPGPRVGLVLSGGAAHGLAHVGVLKVLEEMRVPVDVVAGTSMGAIVGGLYASGMSPAEMEHLLLSIDWDDLFDDRPARSTLSFRRKQDDILNYIDLEMGITKRGIAFPSGLVAGQKLAFLLKMVTLGTVGVPDFDHLPIPFRCVATDIGTGEKVVLSDGSLAEAIRASMSLPAVFSPVERGGRLLVDGGLVDNLPVGEAEAMGAQVLIAVDVSSEAVDPEKLKSFGGILGRTISLPIKGNVAASLPRASVVLRPDVRDISGMDFARAAALIARGEAAARANAASFAPLSVSEEEYRSFLERVRGRRPPAPIVDAIQTVSAGVNSRQITARLETAVGRPLDIAVLQRDLDRIYEMGTFETVEFRLLDDEGRHVLVIDARPKSWGPTFLRIGTGFESNLQGDATVALRATVHAMQLNGLGGELKATLELGTVPGLNAEFYQPLDYRGRFFTAIQAGYTRSLGRVAVENGPVGEARITVYQASGGAGFTLGSWGQLRAGIFRGTGDAEILISEQPLDAVKFDLAGIYLGAAVDTLDDLAFPRTGTFATTDLYIYPEWIGNEHVYYQFRAKGVEAIPLGRKGSAVFTLGWEDTLGSHTPYYLQFTLGDFTRFAALSREVAIGERAAYAGATYLRRIAGLPTRVGRGVYIGGTFELGRVWAKREDSTITNLRPAGSVFAAADTVLGPVYAGLGVNYGGTSTVYVLLGRPF
ncbi:MAG: patatin-like phospholipase family protein [Acidobacteria bacterium]|nr:patatin-like phospholipase family protein [Acidobacteriota bacterium]MCG3194110.1 hypothetical protein [Thermoanaerobaculia bacterium]